MVHIKVITLRQLVLAILAIVLAAALIIFALVHFFGQSTASDSVLGRTLTTSAAVITHQVQAEDISACLGQALPIRSTDAKQNYLAKKLPQLIHLVFGFDPTDAFSIFSHALPGAAIAQDAVIEGLDSLRNHPAWQSPTVTVRFDGADGQTSTTLTLRNSLFSRYRTASTDKSVFIYHTHTTEAYADSVATTSAWRSRDDSQNMIGVGNALCAALDTLGIAAVHDRTYHESPNYNYAYSHSLQALRTHYDAQPQTALFIDVHRDAWIEGSSRARAVQIDGTSCAQLQFVIAKGTADLAAPYYKENAAIAEDITAALEQIAPGITLPVRYANARYNQHVSPGCILVEVGHNENTLAEAHNAMNYLARAISIVLSQS